MPTNSLDRLKRYVVVGHFVEGTGYRVDRPRGCHDWLLIVTAAGQGVVTGEGGTFSTHPGDVALIAPHAPHGYRTADDPAGWELVWAHFVPPPEWKPLLRWPAGAAGIGRLALDDAVRPTVLGHLREAQRRLAGEERHRETLALNSLHAALLWCHEQLAARQGSIDERVAAALEFIARRLDQPLSVAAMARHAGLSPSRFAHLFQQALGVPPMQHVESRRIGHAKRLLETTNLPLATIARCVGFPDPFYFSRRFRQATGQSPSGYRRQQQ